MSALIRHCLSILGGQSPLTWILHMHKEPVHCCFSVGIACRKQRFLASNRRETHAFKLSHRRGVVLCLWRQGCIAMVRRTHTSMQVLADLLPEAARPRRAACHCRGRHPATAHQLAIRWAHLRKYNISGAQVSSTLSRPTDFLRYPVVQSKALCMQYEYVRESIEFGRFVREDVLIAPRAFVLDGSR